MKEVTRLLSGSAEPICMSALVREVMQDERGRRRRPAATPTGAADAHRCRAAHTEEGLPPSARLRQGPSLGLDRERVA